ncbi:MAG: hypothetical protein Q7S28_02550 [bacterium]|nr:hypothetical protein [bacterium]
MKRKPPSKRYDPWTLTLYCLAGLTQYIDTMIRSGLARKLSYKELRARTEKEVDRVVASRAPELSCKYRNIIVRSIMAGLKKKK